MIAYKQWSRIGIWNVEHQKAASFFLCIAQSVFMQTAPERSKILQIYKHSLCCAPLQVHICGGGRTENGKCRRYLCTQNHMSNEWHTIHWNLTKITEAIGFSVFSLSHHSFGMLQPARPLPLYTEYAAYWRIQAHFLWAFGNHRSALND